MVRTATLRCKSRNVPGPHGSLTRPGVGPVIDSEPAFANMTQNTKHAFQGVKVPEERMGAPNTLYRYRFGPAEYSQADESLKLDGNAVALERRPLEVLAELLRQPGQVVTKEELLEQLWGRDEGAISDNVLANAVSKLRRALGPEAGPAVRTVPGVGYRLDAHVERTVLSNVPDTGLALAAGMTVPGRDTYVLEAELSRHPDSEVWLARQPRTRDTRVFKFCAGGERLSAMKREFTLQRVLRANLGERDDIARIVDAQFADSPYWLECEYGGTDLARWAAEDDRLASLGCRERVALLAGIARAVAAAHSVGILHKDLKPSNVLVSAAPGGGWQTRLIDFGSGRLLDLDGLRRLGVTQLGLTVSEQVATDSGSATLFYLAPEVLAGGAPTVQSDLYALGLMLFQCLAGDFRRPMAPGWETQIEHPLLREDIAAATQGNPADRLASVADWVDRLSHLDARLQEREKAQARAQQAAEATRMLERSRTRRPWMLAATATLVLGLGVSTWMYSRARQALAVAEQQTARAQAINTFLTQDVLKSADITRAGSTRPVPMPEVVQRAADKAEKRFVGQPETEASVRVELAQILQNMSALEASETQWRRAEALGEGLWPANDERLLGIRFGLARVLVIRSRFDDARALLARAEADAGPEHLQGTSQVAYLSERARFALLSMTQQAEAAVPHGERALALADRLHAGDLALRGSLRREVADNLFRLGRYEPARKLLNEVLNPPYTAAETGEISLARARIQMARVQVALGENDEAEAMLIAARDLLIQTLGPNDYVAAVARSELANLYTTTERLAEAEVQTSLAYESLRQSVGPDHQATRMIGLNLAMARLYAGQPGDALKQLETGRPWFVGKFGGATAPTVQSIDFHRAQALTSLGEPARALALLQGLDAKALEQASPAPGWAAKLAGERGRALVLAGRTTEGQAMLREAIAELGKLPGNGWVIRPFEQALATSLRSQRTH